MNRIKASEFKAKCLSLMDEVADTSEPLVITKNGKPVATLVPYGEKCRTITGCTRAPSGSSGTSSRP